MAGDTSAHFGTAALAYGPVSLSQSFGNPGSMSVVLDFTFTSLDNDGTAAFNGELSLADSSAPEPATFSIFGLGILALARRYFSTQGR